MSAPGTDGIQDQDWASLARAAAAPGQREDTALLCEFLAFELCGDPYAVPVERVREIVRLRPITPMPRVPEAVRGVISLRGEVIQVLDLRLRLGMANAEPSRRTRIIVIHGEENRTTGLLVDVVTEVLRAAEEAIAPTAPGESELIHALCAREGEFVSLLNLENVLDVGDEL